jgi:hypothetical protein
MPSTRPPPPPAAPLRFWKRRSLRELTPEERAALIEAQVRTTRPIVSAVIGGAALITALIGGLEGLGLAPGIGYPWWVVEAAALAIAGCALAVWHIAEWRVRLVLTLIATALTGTFLTMPVPGHAVDLATRVGLFELMPIALLALMARRLSTWSLACTMFALAALRAWLHGMPASGAALYWPIAQAGSASLQTCTKTPCGAASR